MKNISSKLNLFYGIQLLFCIIVSCFLQSCYSFTGGSVPEHLKSLEIANVEDKSGYGLPQYRDFLTNQLFKKFRDDNSFKIVETRGDARLEVRIKSIRESTIGVTAGNQAGELESERKITVTVEVDYYDAVKKKSIFNKSFSSFGNFDINEVPDSRDRAAEDILEQIADDILLAVVSGW